MGRHPLPFEPVHWNELIEITDSRKSLKNISTNSELLLYFFIFTIGQF